MDSLFLPPGSLVQRRLGMESKKTEQKQGAAMNRETREGCNGHSQAKRKSRRKAHCCETRWGQSKQIKAEPQKPFLTPQPSTADAPWTRGARWACCACWVRSAQVLWCWVLSPKRNQDRDHVESFLIVHPFTVLAQGMTTPMNNGSEGVRRWDCDAFVFLIVAICQLQVKYIWCSSLCRTSLIVTNIVYLCVGEDMIRCAEPTAEPTQMNVSCVISSGRFALCSLWLLVLWGHCLFAEANVY